MSVAAVMLVKDEADVIEHTIRHLLEEGVDSVRVADNGSSDGTYDLVQILAGETGQVLVSRDDEVGYWQSRKTTELALQALADGHSWVIPCDADEVWYSGDGRPVAHYLSSLAGDVMIARARLYDHVPSSADPQGIDPFARIGWRKVHHAPLGKVACRLRPDLVIHAGNHSAETRGTGHTIDSALQIRHFSWRSEERYVRKIANGWRAYAQTDLPENIGGHWRMHGDPDAPDFIERVGAHFRQWFYSSDPEMDDTLVFDPAPVRRPA